MKKMIMDGNTATCHVAYAFTEVALIYPITPSSPMAELADEWATKGKENIFGSIPLVTQMQSESGVAGALHGSLSCGALSTTYTCSQGLLLTVPDMYKIAGELLPTVFHVSARALATHALSIFGDHQDVMACRQTGFALLASASVQECMDLALVAHLATLKSSVPFLHFFDGFRTSHELSKIDVIEYEEIKSLIDNADIERFRERALNPNAPYQKGTAQNPDTYFQNREAANGYYLALPAIVQAYMDKIFKCTGRQYHLFDYHGAPDAERVIVIIGSGGYSAEEAVDAMNKNGESVGVIKVRLYRPFAIDAFLNAIPKTCKKIAVLDRTKEAGSLGEPLYLDVCSALKEKGRNDILVVGGRYGLGGKEFPPRACYAVFENLAKANPKNHFTVGIDDDVSQSSLPIPKDFHLPTDYVACKFYGLGSDGTVGANKNSVKILGEKTDLYAQGYFCYDSRKSGGATVSHLRFGKRPIQAPYLIDHADFIACHNHSYLTRFDMLSDLKECGTFLLNCPWTQPQELETNLPAAVKKQIYEKRAKFYVINGTEIANQLGLNGKNSSIMQAAFFKLNENIFPYEKAVEFLKESLSEKFAKKDGKVIEMNLKAIDETENALHPYDYPSEWGEAVDYSQEATSENGYFQKVIHPILSLRGNTLPVSAFYADGSVPTGTTKLEYHGIAYLLPEWIPENCIQCNQCSFVCPHACIRPFVFSENEKTPDEFPSVAAVGIPNARVRMQVCAQHCMGCGVCANVCPAKNKALVMRPSDELTVELKNWEFAQTLPLILPEKFKRNTVKGSQYHQPLFEFSYACSGCGETPYIKVLTQLFGEKLVIANATGCSSIYGGSSPTCPYTVNKDGKGPAWANSLFEDNAEFGLGMRLALNAQNLPDRSVWIVGGDGWAYDIGYGGLDHVLASGKNVNVLVLDSEVYSNTGGQVSKATPLGAVARFAAAGKRIKKKELGLMAIQYGNVYVAQVSMGADKQQLLNAFSEAESFDGPSLILAYTPCIAHGFDMSKSISEERDAVACGYWPLYRYDPRKETPFTLDSKDPSLDFKSFLLGENRFASLKKFAPEIAEKLFEQAEQDCKKRFEFYKKLADIL